MDYLPFVEKHAAQFGELHKTAADLAKMLDQDFFSPSAISCLHPYLQKDAAVARHDLLEDLSALALRQGVPVPDLEPETLGLLLCREESKANVQRSRELGSYIAKHLATTKMDAPETAILAGFMQAIQRYPVLVGFLDWHVTSAWVNLLLLECGGQPFRELANRELFPARGQNPPSRTLRVIIAEPSAQAIASIGKRLAGFPGLDFGFCRLDAYNLQSGLDRDRAAGDLLAKDPDIVILYGRACVGDGLASLLVGQAVEGRPVLVADSDIPESVAAAQGILSSLAFGHNLTILQTAFMLLGA